MFITNWYWNSFSNDWFLFQKEGRKYFTYQIKEKKVLFHRFQSLSAIHVFISRENHLLADFRTSILALNGVVYCIVILWYILVFVKFIVVMLRCTHSQLHGYHFSSTCVCVNICAFLTRLSFQINTTVLIVTSDFVALPKNFTLHWAHIGKHKFEYIHITSTICVRLDWSYKICLNHKKIMGQISWRLTVLTHATIYKDVRHREKYSLQTRCINR